MQFAQKSTSCSVSLDSELVFGANMGLFPVPTPVTRPSVNAESH